MEIKVFSPLTIRDRLLAKAEQVPDLGPDPETRLAKISQAVTIALEACLKLKLPDDQDLTSTRRRLVMGFIFGRYDQPLAGISSKDLTPGQVKALYDWIGIVPKTDSVTGEKTYPPRPGWTIEANQIANLAWGWVTHRPLEPLGILLSLVSQANPEEFLQMDSIETLAAVVQLGGIIWTRPVERDVTRTEIQPEDLEKQTKPVSLPATTAGKSGIQLPPAGPALPNPGRKEEDSRPSWMKGISK